MDQHQLRVLITSVLTDAPFSMRQIARETGISYDSLRSWATGRRTPQPANVKRLAAFLERRGARLAALGKSLRNAIR